MPVWGSDHAKDAVTNSESPGPDNIQAVTTVQLPSHNPNVLDCIAPADSVTVLINHRAFL